MNYVSVSGGNFQRYGKRFRFVGVNNYDLVNSSSVYSTAQIDAFFDYCKTDGIKVVRLWCFNRTVPATDTAGNFRYLSGGTLNWREDTFIQLDKVLDSAMRKGVMLTLPLVDQWANNKEDYLTWSDTIHSTNYGTNEYKFFEDSNIKQWYKDFIDKLTSRVNTVNGRIYSQDDTIFAWELGNELRYDKNPPDSGQNTVNCTNLAAFSKANGWVDTMATYFKTKDSNHLVGVGDSGHFWDWVNGDSQHNGTQPYGQDYSILGALTDIDYYDFHIYPYEDHATFGLRKYGQSYGFPNAVTYNGFQHQMMQYIGIAKGGGKPVLIGEWGVDKRNATNGTNLTAYPKNIHYKELFNLFFGSDGDGILLWHYTHLFDDINYNIKPNGVHTGGNDPTNDNTDDTNLRAEMAKWNKAFESKRFEESSRSSADSRSSVGARTTVGSRTAL